MTTSKEQSSEYKIKILNKAINLVNKSNGMAQKPGFGRSLEITLVQTGTGKSYTEAGDKTRSILSHDPNKNITQDKDKNSNSSTFNLDR